VLLRSLELLLDALPEAGQELELLDVLLQPLEQVIYPDLTILGTILFVVLYHLLYLEQ
jgi:hypothetical protein